MHAQGINKTELRKDYAAIYERRLLNGEERTKVQRSANGVRAQIVKFFEAFPNARMSPGELKQLLKLPNPIHSIRPRLTDLEEEGWLQALDNDKVFTDFGGIERRYMRAGENGQLKLL